MENINYSDFSWIILSLICASLYFITTFKIKLKYNWFYKSLSIISLGIFCFNKIDIKQIEFIYLSIFLASFGDFWLGYNDKKYFLHGLTAFLFAHILSSIFFILHFKNENLSNNKIISIIIILFLFSLLLFKYIAKYLKNYKIPVILYIIILLIMAYSAILSQFNTIILVIGILSFIISDSILAVQKFKHNFKLADQFIWVSYYLAQLLIISNLYILHNSNL